MITNKDISKRLMGFMQFWEDHTPITIASEIQLQHKDIPFCGTADFIGYIPNKKTNKLEISLVDYKTGLPYKTHQVQLSAYAMIWNKLFPKYKVEKIATLHLKDSWIKKPTYTLKYYNIDYTLVKNVYDVWKWHGQDAKGNDPKPHFGRKFPSKFSLKKEK
tara:strand:- start:1069 stop:1551 length:483 start_codon:yes stop_codon:yes gene_type:complete